MVILKEQSNLNIETKYNRGLKELILKKKLLFVNLNFFKKFFFFKLYMFNFF